jgi:hypothetical protein
MNRSDSLIKIKTGHRFRHGLIIALVVILALITLACSPKSPPTPTGTQDVAVKLVFTTQPGGGEAGSEFTTQPVVAAVDTNGNVVAGARELVVLTVTGSPGSKPPTLYGGTKVTLENGVVNFQSLSIDKAGSYTLTATSQGLTPAVSDPFEITPSAGAKISFSIRIVGGPAGAAFATQPVVTVVDLYGNLATGSTAEVSLSLINSDSLAASLGSQATLSGVTKAKAVNGVVTFKGLWIDKAGRYTLMATTSGMAAVVSGYFDITPAAAARLVFSTQPVNSAAGSALTVNPPAIAVAVQDNYGNIVTDSTAEVSLAITPNTGTVGAVLSGATKIKTQYGVADFAGLSIDKTGTGYTLTASSSGLDSATSEPFDITPAESTPTSSNTTTP